MRRAVVGHASITNRQVLHWIGWMNVIGFACANALMRIDEMIAIFGVPDVIAFCKCNAWKYRYRAGSKGDYYDDIKKADWYISKVMELQESSVEKITANSVIKDFLIIYKNVTQCHALLC